MCQDGWPCIIDRLGAPQPRVWRMSLSKEQLQELPGRGESVVMVRLTAARPGPRGGEARRGQTGAKTQAAVRVTLCRHSRYNHIHAECWPGDRGVKPAVNYWVLQQLQSCSVTAWCAADQSSSTLTLRRQFPDQPQ